MKSSFDELFRRAMPALTFSATALALSACNGDGDGDAYAPPGPDPYAVYPTVRIQEAAPTQSDFIDDVDLGTLLTARGGGEQLTLYTFKSDTAGTSNCQINADSTGCAKVWPPLFAAEGSSPSGDFTIISRADDLLQWAWRDQPLYFFAGGTEAGATTPTPPDQNTGDTNGFLFNDVWYVVRPDPFRKITLNDETVFVSSGAILDFGNDTQVATIDNPEAQFPTARTAARDGYTLYTFDNDKGDDASVCYTTNNCSDVWPPLYADLGTVVPPGDDFKIITRPNGTYQWQYKGKPLYHYSGDTGPADTQGTVNFPNTLWSLAFEKSAAFKPELSTLIANVFQNASGGHCSNCHGSSSGSGGLELGGTQAEVFAELQASSSNPAYADKARTVPEQPEISLLVHKVEGDSGYGVRMPLDGPPYLADDVIVAIRQWIANGARNE